MGEEKMKNHNESSFEKSSESILATDSEQHSTIAVLKSQSHPSNQQNQDLESEEESEESGSEQESTRITQNHPPAVPKSAPHKENEEEEEDESGFEDSQSESQRSTHHPMKSSAADVNGFVPKSKTQDESAPKEGSEYEENQEGKEKSPPVDPPHNGVPNSMNDNFEEGSEDEDVEEGKRSPCISGKTKAANMVKSKKAQGEEYKKRQAQRELAIMVESKKRQAQDDSLKQAKKKNRVAKNWNKSGHNPLADERIIYNALEHMKGRKRMEFEKKLKKLNVEEAEVYSKRVELLREAATFYLQGEKSGRN